MKLIIPILLLMFFNNVPLAVAQICNPNIAPTAPANRFKIHGDGTVTDNKTGLMWQTCMFGQVWDDLEVSCKGAPTSNDWFDALTSAKENNFSGYSDWRLPSIKEAASIVELQCNYPSVNLAIFRGFNSSDVMTSTSISNFIYQFSYHEAVFQPRSRDQKAFFMLVR